MMFGIAFTDLLVHLSRGLLGKPCECPRWPSMQTLGRFVARHRNNWVGRFLMWIGSHMILWAGRRIEKHRATDETLERVLRTKAGRTIETAGVEAMEFSMDSDEHESLDLLAKAIGPLNEAMVVYRHPAGSFWSQTPEGEGWVDDPAKATHFTMADTIARIKAGSMPSMGGGMGQVIPVSMLDKLDVIEAIEAKAEGRTVH